MRHALLDDTLYFAVAVNDATGAPNDGSSATALVRENGSTSSNAPITSGITTSLLSHASYPNGCYEISIVATAANGFEDNKEYSVFFYITVSGITTVTHVEQFKLSAIDSIVIEEGITANSFTDDAITLIETLINEQVLDVVSTDTHSEISSAPPATTDLRTMIKFIYTRMRNKKVQSNTTFTLRNDSDTGTIFTQSVSDDGSEVVVNKAT